MMRKKKLGDVMDVVVIIYAQVKACDFKLVVLSNASFRL